jgi:hypothetical protein
MASAAHEKSGSVWRQGIVMAEAYDTAAAWHEVHSALLTAVQKAKAAVAILKVERRYLLEEIAWNLDDSGHLMSRSSWKPPFVGITSTKTEANVKRKSMGAVKRKKSLPEKSGMSSQKETKKRKKNESEAPRQKATKIILKRTKNQTLLAEFEPANIELDNGDGHSESGRQQEIATLPHGDRPFSTDDTCREQTPSHGEGYSGTTLALIDSEAQNSRPALPSSIYESPSSLLATSETMVREDASTHHQPPPIRNYTSLQDIALNDESDEDRF